MALRAALAAAALTLALAPAAHAACVYPVDYPGDDGPKDRIAAWMAGGAIARDIPGELPVMAALVESGMNNIDYGDSDSRGYFGMRTSIWNSGEYAGYPEDPNLQRKWFIDQAITVRNRAIAGGDAGFGQDENGWGEWVADVQRPAAQYRYRYQLRLQEARELIATGCATPDEPGPPPAAEPPTPVEELPPTEDEPQPAGPDVTAPKIAAGARRRQRLVRQRGVRLTVGCDEACRISAGGTIRVGRQNFPLARSVLFVSPGRPFSVRLAPNPRALAVIRAALAAGTRATASVVVRAHDPRGNDAVPVRLSVAALK